MRIGWKDLRALARRRVPGQVVIQMTDRCNARCPQCEMRVTEKFTRTDSSLDEMKRTVDAAAAKGFSVLSFTGGEPLLFLDQVVELLHHAGRAGLRYLRTGTNGYLFARPEAPGWERRVREVAEKLAGSPIRNFWISVDSAVPEVHERMRGFKGLWSGIERAVPIFHEYGLYPSANLGLNRNIGGDDTWDLSTAAGTESEPAYLEEFYRRFRDALDLFYRRVTSMGFTIVNCCYPMSVDEVAAPSGLQAVYAATSADRIVRFHDRERAELFRALFDTIPSHRPHLRIFSPRTTLHSMVQRYTGVESGSQYGCRGGIDFFFVNARDGNTYPCGYRGNENLGKLWDLDLATTAGPATCRDCDWECWRDPSELFGPVLEGIGSPLALYRHWQSDRRYFELWKEDLRYYRACEFFDGRRPPNFDRLRRFGEPPRATPTVTPKAATAIPSRL
ncbi:MAG: radical SAM protein [Planctomycetota bacterium]